jgi:tetratricopeptide (TPR) repeat protein
MLLRFVLAGALLLLGTRASAAEPSAEARRLYAEGKAEYAQGHYAQAVTLFEQSYALTQSPALLFNMAQAHRLAGPEHCSDALALYKSYLASLPEAENRREVEERIEQLGDCPAPPAPASPPTPAPALPPVIVVQPATVPAPVPSPSPPSRTAPILVAGTGAALLVAGGVLYARAWDKHQEAERVCPCYPGTYDEWEVLTNVSYALLAVGGATLAGGVTWWAIARPSERDQPARAMLGISGRF